MPTVDILMVTYDSPESTELCLPRLLDTCGENARVWLWHNGNHRETLELLEKYRNHPRVARFHHSTENQRLWAPTNWLFQNSEADYLSKVDDDNLLPHGWIETLMAAHESYDKFGVLGCWRFPDEDFEPELAFKKIREFPGGHRVMLNMWTEGSCFLMKRRCRDEKGLLAQGQSFPQYCKKLALDGWLNGHYFPFIKYENLDDPRAPHTMIRSEEDLRPVSAADRAVQRRSDRRPVDGPAAPLRAQCPVGVRRSESLAWLAPAGPRHSLPRARACSVSRPGSDSRESLEIAVFGLGYVGTVSAACFARDGHRVLGVDVNPVKVRLIEEGRGARHRERARPSSSRETRARGLLRATLDVDAAVAQSDLSIVCVGTPSQPNGDLDLRYVRDVCEEIGAALRDAARAAHRRRAQHDAARHDARAS